MNMYRGSPLRLGMCKVCIEAVHSVALEYELHEVWVCVKYVLKQFIP